MPLTTFYIVGISAENTTGALATGRHKTDLFGVILIALVAMAGGGSIRDVFLRHYPLTWIKHPEYIILIHFYAFITTRIPRLVMRLESLFLTLDAIGLTVFNIFGAQIAVNKEYDLVIAISAAVVTGAFGGILRDILCMRVPLASQKEIYAGITIISGVLYYALVVWVQFSVLAYTIITLITSVGTRSLAIKYQWSLPTFSYKEEKRKTIFYH